MSLEFFIYTILLSFKWMNYQENYIKSALLEFRRYKTLGDKTFSQLEDKDIHWTYSESDNNISVIVKHMVGNMFSRWTNFPTEDGEKAWRNRELEFKDEYASKAKMIETWEKGWRCLFEALELITPDNFDAEIKIRNEGHTIFEAVNRQLAHYANHVGQIVFIGRMIKGNEWISLSIPKGKSAEFNREKIGDS